MRTENLSAFWAVFRETGKLLENMWGYWQGSISIIKHRFINKIRWVLHIDVAYSPEQFIS